MKSGDLYRKISSGKVYMFLRTGKLKHPDTGGWYDSVSYCDDEGFYTCTVRRWEEEFVLISEVKETD